MNVSLDHIEPVADHIYTLWLKPETKTTYIAGQYIEMYLPHENSDERGQKRWFTLSSSPTEELLAITTKHFGDPVSTFKQHLFDLKPGDQLKLSEPMGDFVLPKDASIPLVFVVGGIGATPVRSMIKWLVDTGEQRDITLIYGVRKPSEVAFGDVFEAYGLAPEVIVSEPDTSWDGLTGHITAKHILDVADNDPRTLIYVSGPEPLTEKLEADLKTAGVSSDRLVLDFFPGYPEQ